MTIAVTLSVRPQASFYLRGEYTYLRKDLETCLEKRREDGRLGENIQGKKGFSFDINIHMGSGAYVCGEETALIESLEGHRGEARNGRRSRKTPGLYGMPTTVNNVETFCTGRGHFGQGCGLFKSIGTPKSTGPKMLSISGDVARPGVYEIPMGTTIQDVLKIVGGEGAKAVVVGGASAHCIPASEFSRAVSYEDAATGGSVIVFGPDRDMLAVAENFLEFFADESCGQCTPCRIGNVKLLEGVHMLQRGECSTKYLRELCSLAKPCRLPRNAGSANPAQRLSVDRKHFQHEIMGRTCASV